MFESVTPGGFHSVNPEMSPKIYKELISGKVLLREHFDVVNNELVENPLYSELFKHLDHYTTFYKHMGFELVFNDHRHFAFLRREVEDDDREYNRNAFKIMVALSIIGRYFAKSGRDLKYLESPKVGIQSDDIAAIKANEEYIRILKSADFKEGIDVAIAFLLDRGFLFKAGGTRFILTPAAMYFLDLLVDDYGNDLAESVESSDETIGESPEES